MLADELAPGLLYWTARHPEWHPGAFGAEVGSYAAVAGEDLLLVDPLLPEDGGSEALLKELDALVRERVAILITIGYHVRSTATLWERWRGDVPVSIHGPSQVLRRLRGGVRDAFDELAPGADGPAGVRAFAIGRPRRGERPLWLPSHAAVAFGDAVVATPNGDLRMWIQEPLDERNEAFYRDRFAPTLQDLLELGAQRVLVTHGAPVVDGGAEALRRAIASPPWYHHG
jgi:hypothetical protein